MKNSFQNCVERLSRVEADLEEARQMLNFSILERVRLEKEADWLAKKQKSCNRSYIRDGVYSYCTRSYDDIKGGQTRCEVCWREAARKAVAQ